MIFLSLIFLISSSSWATFCTPDDLENLARSIAIPNCVSKEVFRSIKSNVVPDEVCGQCKDTFERNLGRKVPVLSKEEKQKIFLDTALEEYKKNVIENLISVVKVRSLPSTGSNFDKSLKSCSFKETKSFESCGSPVAKKLLADSNVFSQLKNSLNNELAKILSSKQEYNPQDTLLSRNAKSCFVSEKDLMLHHSMTLEEVITPNVIAFFQNIEPSKFKNIDEMILTEEFRAAYGEEASEFLEAFKSHPFLQISTNTPTSLKTFFKTIQAPGKIENLRSAIYSAKNGKDFDDKLASSCEKSFEALTKSICSNDFEKGNLNIDKFANFRRWPESETKVTDNELASTEADLENNLKILRICENKPNLLLLSSTTSKINETIPEQYKNSSLTQYRSGKYEQEIGDLNTLYCENKDKNNCSDETNKRTFNCKFLEKFKTPTRSELALASSSNKEVNTLLRSMIGDTTTIDPKTKEILILEGILPKSDGTMVAQPEVPERKPEYYAKQAANPSAPQARTAIAQSTQSASPRRGPANYQNDFAPSYQAQTAAPSNSINDGLANLLDDTNELKNIQNEIRRRLGQMPNGKPANKNEARQIARQAFTQFNQPLSSNMEESVANEIMNVPTGAATSAFAQTQRNQERPGVSAGPTKSEKAFQAANAALLAAQPNQATAGVQDGSAATGKPRDLTKVAINYSDDPKVNLTDIFNQKIEQNDLDTQLVKTLLKNRTNFLLQVKSLNFKIVFNERNGYNLLLDSGNAAEAERIRPQLEMFLRKLKV